MKYGISDNDFETLARLVIKPLKNHGASVYIFGSRATGKQHPYSDVDILYIPTSEISLSNISKIKEDIEESMFPYTVDLVSDLDLADSYRASVNRDKVEL